MFLLGDNGISWLAESRCNCAVRMVSSDMYTRI